MRTRSTLLAVLSLAAATPAFSEQVYAGRQFITAASKGCFTSSPAIVQVGEGANIVYHPITFGAMAEPESLAVLSDFRAIYMEPVSKNGLNGTGLYEGTKISTVGTLVPYSGSYNIAITRISATVVSISGRVSKAYGVEGCSYTFLSTLGIVPHP